ncbi:expansin [Pseudozyma hubeiensis SY62]|uniref:Expansin n=1 Tax=Pseudozyma hubeiensis (strain SY62) TaxID=1305764 RepID=R9NWD7_PSEHS|nr:expansin [Pseudozyma hubeiensis SY62]GAC92819.1 expansin [Pseudozyma hubeiensis SY62]
MTRVNLSSLLLAVATTMALLQHTVSAEVPAAADVVTPTFFVPPHEHIGTPAHVAPAREHIGTPAHVAPAGQHIGTPSSSAPEEISKSMSSLSKPRIQDTAADYPNLDTRGRHHVKARQHVSNGKVTFYAGSQLLNPACPGASSPSDSSMIAAISFDSPFNCGDRIRIAGKGKSVVVTAVDRCAGCNSAWLDVTKGVFRIFDSLDAGVLNDVSFTKMQSPVTCHQTAQIVYRSFACLQSRSFSIRFRFCLLMGCAIECVVD